MGGGRFGGREHDLGRAAGAVRVGLRREVISPGKQSGPRHANMSEEEIFVVLQGRGTLLRAMSAWRWDPVRWWPFPLGPA
jgi:uncharacterized cupin superfamily protein